MTPRQSRDYRDRCDMTGNVLDVYARASRSDVEYGRSWYADARRIVDGIADWSGAEPERVAAALAALSPRNPWRWNVADAAVFALAARTGAPMPRATTFGANQRKAWDILQGGPIVAAGPKVAAFTAAIMGRHDAVVVDVWAARVATRGASNTAGRRYELMALAYRVAADAVGETPRDLQAITWLVAQREGLGSGRRGRTDRAFKRGTPEIVRTLIGS